MILSTMASPKNPYLVWVGFACSWIACVHAAERARIDADAGRVVRQPHNHARGAVAHETEGDGPYAVDRGFDPRSGQKVSGDQDPRRGTSLMAQAVRAPRH
ncbi:hypothetical protein PF005_g2560 [Phytophthora fragariae]|uniref:RxLR effector protein n=1 Tax=Phytophthora fragariae TaxID=53985 RepID=A0A6A4E3G2_9STRA|nr:hypothetical protein PF003_g1619 [Phytophthora fragariae]KAE8944835.1 hypothetical protein PF009_g5506 [Phytophthora fragariae]KAE9015746.1 hypothetical protein PF011_g7471 [Phytophthora fragariae]KAE9127908.1 hypothetical protein PF010_g4712 [Phytophthora fragariae]KAE9131733.1 hypothetical protein PF007_g4004 [Phytophthora fragariae]